MHHEQDIRNMGGLRKHLPVTHITFLIGCIAIAGIPPFSGFFSKDEILMGAFAHSPVLYFIGTFSALLTAFYMFRLYALTFLGSFRGTHEQEHHLHESPAAMTLPLVVLAILAVVAGFLGIPEVFAKDAHWLQQFLAPVFSESTARQAHHEISHSTEYALMGGTVAAILAIVFFAVKKFSNNAPSGETTGFARVLEHKWYVDELYDAIISKPLRALSVFFNNVVEKLAIDGIVNGVGKLVQYGGRQMRWLQSGQVGSYILIMVVATVLFFVIQLFGK
jgi:NADH-quinone oxidoreductase subunit L